MREAILGALSYHDLFDRPLSLHELRLALPSGASDAAALLRMLEALAGEGRVECIDGFWQLAGRPKLSDVRQSRYVIAEAKYEKAIRFLRLARHAPFLRAAAVCNTLARSNAREESDIDLFVVAEPGRVWLCRLLVTGLAALLGVRPSAEESRDRICLSFFAASDALDLAAVSIPNDVYLRQWIRELAPLVDEDGQMDRLKEANRWMRSVRADEVDARISARRRLASSGRLKRAAEKLLNLAGAFFEAQARRVQLKLLPDRLKRAAEDGFTAVILSDAMLKFHDEDRREEIRDRYRARLAEVLGRHPTRNEEPIFEPHELRALA